MKQSDDSPEGGIENVVDDEKKDATKTSSSDESLFDIQEIATKLYSGAALAPMVRASTTPLRTLAIKYGADFVYTEELVDRSITGTIRTENATLGTIDYCKDVSKLSKKQQRKLKEDGGPALFLRIDRKVERGKLVCQIGSGEPELALAAALRVHRDVDAVDLNMGCPKKFSVSGGMGSALLSDPDRACKIIRTLSGAMNPLKKPVSAKIRLLKDVQSTVDFVAGLIHAGANAVAIHGRRVGDADVKAADWKSLEEVVSLVKSKYPTTPILLNGDFYTRQEFVDFQEKTGASGVLLGRPALYNTSIFRKPKEASPSHCKFDYNSPLLINKTTVIRDYLREVVKYDYHYKNAKYVISEMMNSRRAPYQRVPYLPQEFPGGQTIGKICSCTSMEEFCRIWNIEDYDKLVQTREQQQAPAGEHTYSDSYILQNLVKASSGSFEKRKEEIHQPASKRLRTD